jgi:hypothetical protein
MKNVLNLSIALAIFTALFLTSCGENNSKMASSAATIEGQAINPTGRSLSEAPMLSAKIQKAVAAEYSYKTLASFQKGKVKIGLSTLADLQNESITLVVLYEAGADWSKVFQTGDYSKTGNDMLNGLMASYGLSITKHFDLDEFNEGIVLDSGTGKVANPVEAAREISMVDGVLMVEVKQAPKAEVKGETVSTGK